MLWERYLNELCKVNSSTFWFGRASLLRQIFCYKLSKLDKILTHSPPFPTFNHTCVDFFSMALQSNNNYYCTSAAVYIWCIDVRISSNLSVKVWVWWVWSCNKSRWLSISNEPRPRIKPVLPGTRELQCSVSRLTHTLYYVQVRNKQAPRTRLEFTLLLPGGFMTYFLRVSFLTTI